MASAMEAEVAAIYTNAVEIVSIRNTLTELGHPQPPTPIKVDSQTAVGFANDTLKFKRSKAIDMRFHWIKDRTNRDQFTVYWRPGSENRADYITKFHPPSHCQKMRRTFFNVQRDHQINALFSCLVQGCDNVRISRYERLRKTRRR